MPDLKFAEMAINVPAKLQTAADFCKRKKERRASIIDENIVRKGSLTAAFAYALRRRKEIYEEMDPET